MLPLLRHIAKQYPQLPILIDHVGIAWGTSLPEIAWGKDTGIEVVMQPGPDFGIDATVGIFDDTPNVYFKFTEINVERMQERGVETAPAGAPPGRPLRRRAHCMGIGCGPEPEVALPRQSPPRRRMHRAARCAGTCLFLHHNAARIYGEAR